MFPVILRSRDIGPAAKGAALLHLCMSLNQPVLLVGVVSGILAGVLAPSLVPTLLTAFVVTVAWVIFCATTFLRAGHNFIRNGEMPPGRFAVVLLRFVGGQVAMVVRSLFVHMRKAAAPAQARRVRPHAQEGRVDHESRSSTLAQQRMVGAERRPPAEADRASNGKGITSMRRAASTRRSRARCRHRRSRGLRRGQHVGREPRGLLDRDLDLVPVAQRGRQAVDQLRRAPDQQAGLDQRQRSRGAARSIAAPPGSRGRSLPSSACSQSMPAMSDAQPDMPT